MTDDPVRGRTIRWAYEDGPVGGRTFEHAFDDDGSVTYREVSGDDGRVSAPVPYQASRLSPDVYVVSYLASSGTTLTTVVHEPSGRIVSFASNEKTLVAQHGTLAQKGEEGVRPEHG